MGLTPEQQAKIDENRRKALERLKSKGILTDGNGNRVVSKLSLIPIESKATSSAIKLTNEQRKMINQNRKKALAKLKEKQQNFRDATIGENLSLTKDSTNGNKIFKGIKPFIQKSSYIDYDLSVMKDTKGGFISSDLTTSGNQEKTFEEWQEKQRIIRDLPPPKDLENAIKCKECGTFEINQKLWNVFQCRVCQRCEKSKPDKYSLLTKTECREDYFLTDPELKDTKLLARLEKPNPHGTFSRMQLFLRYQVEEFAFKKWGGPEGLDAEWVKREEGKIKRRDKKYELKMKEMRKKTRAEEYNRKLREGKFGQEHTHEWSLPFDGGKNEDDIAMVRRKCLHCGFETEEILI